MRILPFAAIALSAMLSPAFAALDIPNAQPKVGAEQWKQVLDNTWQGLKKRNIEECRDKPIYNQNQNSPGGLICRPKSETPYDAVSEGIGYGMLLALYANDQQTFDLIYNAGKEFHIEACNGWRKPADGGGTESGSASDADEDIAVALIFADKLKTKGVWGNSNINYANEAQSSVNCVWTSVDNNTLLTPGNTWQGWNYGTYNAGYFAPAWYRIFKDFDNQNRNWINLINNSYDLIKKSPGYSKGMVPDFQDKDGNAKAAGYNSYYNGAAFFKDAIRMLWRVATDVIWFPNEHPENSIGRTYLKNAVKFMNDKNGPEAANFYTMDGELIPADDKWTDFNDRNNPNTWRWRREHSHLTVGQWLTAAMAVGTDDDKIAWSSEMAKFYDWENKADFFGWATDTTGGGGIEDTLHNEMYFDQFLAWFGVSLMSGTWVNVVGLLDNPVANTEGITEKPFPDKSTPIIPPIPDPPTGQSELPQDSLEASGPQEPGGNPNQGGQQSAIARNKPIIMQINQTGNALRMLSQNEVAWQIHNLQGKLLFSSNSKEISWDAGNFKGAVIVSASNGSDVKRKLAVIK